MRIILSTLPHRPAAADSDDALLRWKAHRVAAFRRMTWPLLTLAWALLALLVFQQLLSAVYMYTIRHLSTQSLWVSEVMLSFAWFTRNISPALVIASELTFFTALLMAMWLIHLLRIPGEVAVVLLPAEVYRFELREYRRAIMFWLSLLCIAPTVTQLLFALAVGTSMPSGWRGSQEEVLLGGMTLLVVYPALGELELLMQLRLPPMLNSAWRLLGPAVAFVAVRAVISMVQVTARDRSQDRLNLWDPPFPWHALAIVALIIALGVSWQWMRRINAVMPKWYRGI